MVHVLTVMEIIPYMIPKHKNVLAAPEATTFLRSPIHVKKFKAIIVQAEDMNLLMGYACAELTNLTGMV